MPRNMNENREERVVKRKRVRVEMVWRLVESVRSAERRNERKRDSEIIKNYEWQN